MFRRSPTRQHRSRSGYFKAEPFGWTDCAETDDGAIALYELPPAPSVPVEPMENIALNEWLDKTEWVQKQLNTFPVSSLGMHRADVMRLEIDRLRKLLSAAPTPAEAQSDVARDARLQVESEFAALLPGVAYMDVPDGGSPTVQEQVKRMALDAARYRWLSSKRGFSKLQIVSTSQTAACKSVLKVHGRLYRRRHERERRCVMQHTKEPWVEIETECDVIEITNDERNGLVVPIAKVSTGFNGQVGIEQKPTPAGLLPASMRAKASRQAFLRNRDGSH